MSKPKTLPNRIVMPDGDVYVPKLFLVHPQYKKKGVPTLCTLILDDDKKIGLAGGEEFLIAYVNDKMLQEES